MQQKLTVTPDTRLTDILDAYPWLPEKLMSLDERFKALSSPLVKLFIRRATLADAAKKAGYPVEQVMEQLDKLVEARAE